MLAHSIALSLKNTTYIITIKLIQVSLTIKEKTQFAGVISDVPYRLDRGEFKFLLSFILSMSAPPGRGYRPPAGNFASDIYSQSPNGSTNGSHQRQQPHAGYNETRADSTGPQGLQHSQSRQFYQPHTNVQQQHYNAFLQHSAPAQGGDIQFYPSSFSGGGGSGHLDANYAVPVRLSPSTSPSMGTMHVVQPVDYLSAFGTGRFPGEPSLLEELEINLSHIQGKTVSVLSPFRTIDKHIMEDTDLVGPLLFCLLFGISLLLSGKVHFGYIYGVALMGWIGIWGILNLISEAGIDMLRAASVLGYCLLPMVALSFVSIFLPLQYLFIKPVIFL